MRVACMQIWDNITCIHVCRLPMPLPLPLLCHCRLETISFECHHSPIFTCVPMSVYVSHSLSAASRRLHCMCLCVCLHVKIIYVPQFTDVWVCLYDTQTVSGSVRASVCVCTRWRLMILKTIAKFLYFMFVYAASLFFSPHICESLSLISQFSVANNYYCFCLKLTQEDLQINAHWLRISRVERCLCRRRCRRRWTVKCLTQFTT